MTTTRDTGDYTITQMRRVRGRVCQILNENITAIMVKVRGRVNQFLKTA